MDNSEKRDIVKEISDLKLYKSIEKVIPSKEEFKALKKIIWGAGDFGRTFVETHLDIGFSYIVDSRLHLQGKKFCELDITSPEVLYSENPTEIVVFLATAIHNELTQELRKKGIEKIVVPNIVNLSGIELPINRKDINEIFLWLNNNKINYVYPRKVISSLKNSGDIDILLDSKDADKLLDFPFLADGVRSEVTFLDIAFSEPLGLNLELPVYPIFFSKILLNPENRLQINGISTLTDEVLLAVYMYRAFIHKGTEEAVSKYYDTINELKQKLNLSFDITIEGLWNYFSATEYFPMIDFIRKWAGYTQSPFLLEKTKLKSLKENNYAVFVFRNFFKDRKDLMNEAAKIIEDNGFIRKDIIILEEKMVKTAKLYARGGVWEESHQGKLGGDPYAFGIFINKNGNVRNTKEKVREFVNNKIGLVVNSIHSADDSLEALEYIKLINYKY